MKARLFLVGLALFLSAGIYASLTQSFAQDGVYDSDTTLGSGGTITTQTNNTTGTTIAEEAFNPLWLLPLIAIPLLLYALWPKNRHSHALEGRGSYVGVKGGQAEDADDQDDDANYKPEPPRYV